MASGTGITPNVRARLSRDIHAFGALRLARIRVLSDSNILEEKVTVLKSKNNIQWK